MKNACWFTRLLSQLRIATAVLLISAAAAMAFVAAKPSSPSLLAKSDRKGEAKLAKYARSPAFANHLQTLLGREDSSGEGSRLNGYAQEMYDNTAYPRTHITPERQRGAALAADTLLQQAPALPDPATWVALGPNGVPASATVASESTASSVGTTYSGRATAIGVAPNCTQASCTVFIGAAGGGIWKSTSALAATPSWAPASSGLPSQAIGSIAFDPNYATNSTLYVGLGEPNGSSDSEAGLGLYKSTNGGGSWTLVAGSTANTAPCAGSNQQLSGNCPVATGRSIGAIAIDPNDPTHIFIGTDVARRGSSSVNGGRFTPPGSAKVGLYESTNGGASFTAKVILTQDTVNPGSANGGDFYRGGCSHIELYRSASETEVYASFFDYGVFRRSNTQDGDTNFHQIFLSGGNGTLAGSSFSRTEFSLAPNGGNLRVYVGDADANGLGTLYRVDNGNVAASSLFNGSNIGWTSLSCSTPGQACFSSYNYCGGQCTYDMPVYSPPGSPNIVYIGGAMQYDEIFTAHRPSNGRAVQRSQDAGVHFTDMTQDNSHPTPQSTGLSRHPDQHAIAAVPFNPNIVFNADDGGVWRINGSFTNASSVCSVRGLTGTDLTDCQMWLAKIPTTITSLNKSLQTLQYQSLSYDPSNPGRLLGGTQDNGTHLRSGGKWTVNVFGDGGQSGFNPFHSNIRFHNYFEAAPDVNFIGDNELGWDWIGDPLFEVEPQSFYIPMIYDPKVDGTIFAGLDFVWRTKDNGGDQATLDLHCNELTGDFPPNVTCGDWVRLAPGKNKALGDGKFWGSKGTAGYIVATRRAPNDNGTLWVGTRRGRVFVTSNADVVNANSVAFYRIDTALQPTRFVSGIDVDPANPNHAFVSYSGYNAYATAAATATGHVFEVTYNPATHAATWSSDLATNLGDQPVRAIAVDWQTDDIYASTDFNVFVRKSGTTTWTTAAGGLPKVATYGLTLDAGARVLYAATHGRSAYSLTLP